MGMAKLIEDNWQQPALSLPVCPHFIPLRFPLHHTSYPPSYKTSHPYRDGSSSWKGALLQLRWKVCARASLQTTSVFMSVGGGWWWCFYSRLRSFRWPSRTYLASRYWIGATSTRGTLSYIVTRIGMVICPYDFAFGRNHFGSTRGSIGWQWVHPQLHPNSNGQSFGTSHSAIFLSECYSGQWRLLVMWGPLFTSSFISGPYSI